MRIYKNEKELLEKANDLKDRKVKEIISQEYNLKNKGKIGQLVEKDWFGIPNNSSSKPDFENLGIELKVCPLRLRKKDNKFVAKERVKISQINFKNIIFEESFSKSHLYLKIQKILFIFYKYDPNFKENQFLFNKLFKIESDIRIFKQIEQDFNYIKDKISLGKAHLLSESDTKFLGCVRNGTGKNENMVEQPNSNQKAYKRAFSFKLNLINHILQNTHHILKKSDLELFNYISNKFEPYIGKSYKEILLDLGYSTKYHNSKNVAKRIFELLLKKENLISEIENRGNILLKTTRLNNKQDNLKEEWKINLHLFEQYEIYNNHGWDETDFSKILEKTFLVFLSKEDGENLLDSKYIGLNWFQINDQEFLAIKSLFEESFLKYKNGGYVVFNDKGSKTTPWSSKKSVTFNEKNICHIRPGAQNRKDIRITLFGEEICNQMLWINKDIIFSKLNFKDN